jgi:hypothetical protein
VQDDGALDGFFTVRVGRADTALGMEHPALLGAERRHLAEHVPVAPDAALKRGRAVLREVQRKAAHQLSGPVVQLDRRRQAIAREDGLLPHQERRPEIGGRVR